MTDTATTRTPIWHRSSADAMLRLWSGTMQSMAAGVEALSTATTDLFSSALTDPTRLARVPQDQASWLGQVTARREPQWVSEHEIVFETPIARLRDYSTGHPSDVAPTLVLPPQAGHSSSVVDFAEGQSQMATILAAGLDRAYTLDWVSATAATKGTTIEDYIAVIKRAIRITGGPVNLIGDCQGGWLAAIYAALHPEDINTLTLAGAPIDFHVGDGAIPAHVQVMTTLFGIAPYRAMVAAGGGNMPGSAVLNGFIAIRPEAEIAKQLQLFNHLDSADHVQRYRAFEDWFKHTQDVPGTFYLWLVEHLFWRNELIKGELEVGGRRVDLANISCPLYLLAGATDHITPPPQLYAASAAVSTPAEDITERTCPGGHLGLFMGREALREHWSVLLADIHARSRHQTDREADAQAALRRVRPETETEPPVPAP